MSAKAKVCKNDLVVVLAGKDVGKQGRVILVKPRDGKVLVEGVAEIQKHIRPNPQRGETGGIVKKEALIDISNVQVICPSCGKPTRVSMKVNEDGTKNRFCKKCNSIIERN